jgi:hypothetical protein
MLLTFLASGGGALLGGLLGAFAGLLAARWTSRNARRDQMWKRVEWALEMTLREETKAATLGGLALREIIVGGLADARDIQLITALASTVLDELAAAEDVESADFVLELDPDNRETPAGGSSTRQVTTDAS